MIDKIEILSLFLAIVLIIEGAKMAKKINEK